METLKDENYYDILTYEAYLRRAAEHDAPYMLKGSLLTRQYLPDLRMRYADDIDWMHLHHIDDPVEAGRIFSAWCTAVTETQVNDGVTYKSFRENDFWRMIDYAMADDFPTVNTDLECTMDGKLYDYIRMDISFNLDMAVAPVPLLYRPLVGEPFVLRYTCPLSLQVAWKLHQTLVRPRYKDIYDLIYLIDHPAFDIRAMDECIAALTAECARDKMSLRDDLLYLMADPDNVVVSIYDTGEHAVPGQREELPALMRRLLPALRDRGLTTERIESLPSLPEVAKSLRKTMADQRVNNKKNEEYRLAEQISAAAREARRKLIESIPPRKVTPYTRPVKAPENTIANDQQGGWLKRFLSWLLKGE